MKIERLDKWVSSHTEHSRKEVKMLARAGKILVNGQPVSDSGLKIPEDSEVVVNGEPLFLQSKVYILMNKPAGVLSATRDNFAPTVLDILPKELQRPGLFPAGRLDKDTTGLVLITNDGDFAHQILAPKNKVPKVYEVMLDKPADWDALQAEFAKGLSIGKGEMTSPATLRVLKEGDTPLVEVTIYEGMFHQVKRMFARFDLSVSQLKRIAIGGLVLDSDLPEGSAKLLPTKEIAKLCAK